LDELDAVSQSVRVANDSDAAVSTGVGEGRYDLGLLSGQQDVMSSAVLGDFSTGVGERPAQAATDRRSGPPAA